MVKKIQDNLTNIVVVLGLIASIGAGFTKFAKMESSIEQLTEASKSLDIVSVELVESNKQETWAEYVREQGEGLLSNEVDSWMTGINSNVEGRQTRIIARYSGSAKSYREGCEQVVENGYKELNLV